MYVRKKEKGLRRGHGSRFTNSRDRGHHCLRSPRFRAQTRRRSYCVRQNTATHYRNNLMRSRNWLPHLQAQKGSR